MTMDDRIRQDLTELYNEGATPGEIQNAVLLDGLIQAKDGERSFATKALPRYYYGDRNAKTIMVMLNPGSDVVRANQNLMDDIAKLSMSDAKDIENYHNGCIHFGHDDRGRKDNFDLKQAFFIHKWKNTGISLPRDFCHKSTHQTLLDAKEAVLTQKLQLELIPYPSRSFSNFNPQKIHLLVSFVENLFDEIFSQERKYVIFCSKKISRCI